MADMMAAHILEAVQTYYQWPRGVSTVDFAESELVVARERHYLDLVSLSLWRSANHRARPSH